MVTGDNYEIRSSDVLDKLNWQPLTRRRNKQIITLVQKLLIGEMTNFQENVLQLSNNTRYQLRRNKTLLKFGKPKINVLE